MVGDWGNLELENGERHSILVDGFYIFSHYRLEERKLSFPELGTNVLHQAKQMVRVNRRG